MSIALKPLQSMKSVVLTMILIFVFSTTFLPARAQSLGRHINLTLIPDFAANSIQFNGKSDPDVSIALTKLPGLPLNIQHSWKTSDAWNMVGTIKDGKILHNTRTGIYRLQIGPVQLQPFDELRLVIPFVNLRFDEVQPEATRPEGGDAFQHDYSLLYVAGAAGHEMDMIEIPFMPIAREIDLVLTPLLGEAIAGKTNAFRLSGHVQYASLQRFESFAHYCQNSMSRLSQGDYRVADLLSVLDFPHYIAPNVFSPAFQFKPTNLELRSKLLSCTYDQAEHQGRVEASFSGRVFEFTLSNTYYPPELQGSEPPDGNFSFEPNLIFPGVRGYEIRLGQIVLGPHDQLNIAIPNTDLQADSITPPPHGLSASPDEQTLVIYHGPAMFDLSVPYIPKTQLYFRQFPAILRPGAAALEAQFGPLFPRDRSGLSWIVLLAGFFVIFLSGFLHAPGWLTGVGWFCLFAGFYFGVPGPFGLLCPAAVLFTTRMTSPHGDHNFPSTRLDRIMKGVAGLVAIFMAVYFNGASAEIFQGLSAPDLTPFTPFLLAVLILFLFVLFYGKTKSASSFSISDLPVLVLFLVVSSLFDVFDTSLMALVVVFVGCIFIFNRAASLTGHAVGETDTFGKELETRVMLAFGNRLVPVAILILILFAMTNDLTSTYANELNITVAWLAAPLIIPLLDLASVLIAFSSVAFLFVLVYPFIPAKAGYARAILFALFLFLVFLFGVGTDNRLILALPNIIVGRVLYYFSVPVLVGIYFDINEYMESETKRRAAASGKEEKVTFQAASATYLKNLQSLAGTLAAILSLVAPSLYSYVSSQPVITTYFSLLEILVVPPI